MPFSNLLMSDQDMMVRPSPGELIFYPNEEFSRLSHISNVEEYLRLYQKSIEEPEEFWTEVAEEFYWTSWPNKELLSYNFDTTQGPVFIKWMDGAVTNMCYNVVDRVINKGLGDRVAYYWEGNDGISKKSITYNELRREICKFSNVLKGLGIRKGDRVAMYMSVSIDLVVAMLACARIGAIHTVVFAGFSAEALADRMIDANCVLLITSDGSFRANKLIPLKMIADSALTICANRGHKLRHNIVNNHLSTNHGIVDENNNPLIQLSPEIDISWDDLMRNASDVCEPEWLNAEDPLFILYTSGSTGKPKGVVHTIGGYLLHSYLSFKYVFDYNDGDVFFSTADLGWMAAHTFNVYGALANAASIVLFEGTPIYPNPSRLWEIIDRLKVNIFYTAPTAIRTLMKFGDDYVKAYNRNSLKVLGTAGEPINPEAWLWYMKVVGEGRCPVVDTYWQTETGAPMITSLPGCTPMKPGSAVLPFFGVIPAVLDNNGREVEGPTEGHLVFKKPWPGLARTIDGKHDLFEMTYFHKFKGYYMTGDGVRRDHDGYYWVTGRSDDTLNVSGHLLSTVEVETAIVEHRAVAEAAAVSAPHPIKGEALYMFVVLNNEYQMCNALEFDIKQRARDKIGPFAVPDVIQVVTALPKTKSGKVMRRILHKIIRNDCELGDTSTMADESVLDELFSIEIKC